MTRPANGRAHLSIGEVLSLLQDEFPDVTISKIRFLESQGLLDPERTPSGYRKFYESDIRRLRWILRQQKEHYLPLKVIKDRLDSNGGEIPDGGDGDEAPPPPDEERSRGRLGVRHLAEGVLGASIRNGHHATAVEAKVVPSAPDRWQDSPVHDVPLEGEQARARPPRRLPAPPPPPAPPLSGRAGSPRDDREGSSGRKPDVPRQAAPRPVTPRDAKTSPERAPAGGDPPPGPETAPADPAVASSGGMSDVSLTAEELASASGLSVRDLRDLEKFGLIEPRDGIEGETYDGEALVIAHTAAGFLQHGIEARHMRAYKVASEREADMFEQIVRPVVKQRNPDARVQAGRTVAELMRLGEVMRGALLRRALRDYSGGGR